MPDLSIAPNEQNAMNDHLESTLGFLTVTGAAGFCGSQESGAPKKYRTARSAVLEWKRCGVPFGTK